MKNIDAREAICVFWLHEGFICSEEEWKKAKETVKAWNDEQVEEYIHYIEED